jgi:peptidoglycan/LPS O-acetylase OafA/YrhL
MPQSQWLNFLRPYLALLLVGATLLQPTSLMVRQLNNRPLVFVAGISYALYVIHPILTHTGLGSGESVIKYLKRPLFFAVLFMLAYGSTYYYESWFMKRGKRWADRVNRLFERRRAPAVHQPTAGAPVPVPVQPEDSAHHPESAAGAPPFVKVELNPNENSLSHQPVPQSQS